MNGALSVSQRLGVKKENLKIPITSKVTTSIEMIERMGGGHHPVCKEWN